MKRIHLSLLMLIGMGLSACGTGEQSNEWFLVSRSDEVTKVGIKTAALGQEFLLHPSLLDQSYAPSFNALQSRVVVFQQTEGRVQMLQSNKGISFTQELNPTHILASFPIVEEKGDVLFIDFAAGMSKVFLAADMHVPDFEYFYDPAATFQAIPVSNSYLEKAELTKREELVLQQVAQIELPYVEPTVKVVYELSRYHEDESFTPAPAQRDLRQVGFFETARQLREAGGADIRHSVRFNTAAPIVYAISHNTPEEYRQAVRDGILYWNRAFGREVIQVVDAAEDVDAMDPSVNLVQWMTWDDAGFAYADFHSNPRTGQIQRARVYLPSSFAFSSKAQLRSRFQSPFGKPQGPRRSSLTLAGFQGKDSNLPHCRIDAQRAVRSAMTELLNPLASDETILRGSQDTLRQIVAHEVGHTLGLRHNFAGSLSSNVPLAERSALFRNYLKDDQVPETAIVSSSVMEYSDAEASYLMGHAIRNQRPGLAYDRMAIGALYDGAAINSDSLFCTDSDMYAGYLDCAVWDGSGSALEYAAWQHNQYTSRLADDLAEVFIYNKKPPLGYDAYAVEEIALEPGGWAGVALTRRNILQALTTDVKLLRVERTFPKVDSLNRPEVKAAVRANITADVARLGGLKQLLAPLPENFASQVEQRFGEISASPLFRAGQAPGGEYAFTDAELASMKDTVRRFTKLVDSSYRHAELAAFSPAPSYSISANGMLQSSSGVVLADGPLAEELVDLVAERAATVLFATDGVTEATVAIRDAQGAITTKVVSLPKFRHPQEARLAGARVLSNLKGESVTLGSAQKRKLRAQLSELLIKTLPAPLSSVDLEGSDPAAAKWVVENRSVEGSLQGF